MENNITPVSEPKKRGSKKAETIPPVQTPQTTQAQSDVLSAMRAELETLKKQSAEDQKKLAMLEAVADKGRVFNYESSRTTKKPSKVKLSVYNGGIITAWRTIKDELIHHPTTGKTIGEVQEYEVILLQKDGSLVKQVFNGYPSFNSARYTERIEAEVKGKREDFDGTITFDLILPDGRVTSLDAKFVN